MRFTGQYYLQMSNMAVGSANRSSLEVLAVNSPVDSKLSILHHIQMRFTGQYYSQMSNVAVGSADRSSLKVLAVNSPVDSKLSSVASHTYMHHIEVHRSITNIHTGHFT